MKPGSLEAKHAWSIMAVAIVVVGMTAAATFGGSSLINGVVFLVGAFLSTYMTKASKTLAFGVWFLGSVLCAFTVFFITMKFASHATHLATSAADLSGNDNVVTAADAVDTAATVVGGIGGIFFGFISFVVTMVTALIGLIAGSMARPNAAPQPLP